MELMTAHRTWTPAYNELTPEQLQMMVRDGLTTDLELWMWRRGCLLQPRLNWLLLTMALVCLDLQSAPIQ